MRDMISMIKSEARRRPDLKLLIDMGCDLTDEHIRDYSAPMLWFKKALVAFRDQERMRVTTTNGDQTGWVHGFSSDYMGSAFRWMVDSFIQVSDRSSVSITAGDWVWVDPNGSFWIDTIKCQAPPKEFQGMVGESCTKTRYQQLVRENILARHGLPLDAPSTTQGSWFTIVRAQQ